MAPEAGTTTPATVTTCDDERTYTRLAGRDGHNQCDRKRRCGGRRERGSVTVELAVGLPTLILLLMASLAAIEVALTKVECVDAARVGARAAARGESAYVAVARLAPTGASTQVDVEKDWVRVTVRVVLTPLDGLLPALPVSASAVASREPGVVVAEVPQ